MHSAKRHSSPSCSTFQPDRSCKFKAYGHAAVVALRNFATKHPLNAPDNTQRADQIIPAVQIYGTDNLNQYSTCRRLRLSPRSFRNG